MSITLKNNADANVVYNQVRSVAQASGVKTTYNGPTHTDVSKDNLAITLQDPKRASDSYGNRRSTISYYKTIDVEVPGGVTTVAKDLKIEINVSLPVGATTSELFEAGARIQAFLASEAYLQAAAFDGAILP